MLRNMIPASIVQGHRVASGLNGNPRFPGGTLRMQLPLRPTLPFVAAGLPPSSLMAYLRS
jgi:hypothetical protein